MTISAMPLRAGLPTAGRDRRQDTNHPSPMERVMSMTDAEYGEQSATETGGVAADQLRSFIERIENLDEQIKGLQEDRKEVLAEAKSSGFDAKTIAHVVRLRRKAEHERREEDELLELYKSALGMG